MVVVQEGKIEEMGDFGSNFTINQEHLILKN